jgi:hypothetical protein
MSNSGQGSRVQGHIYSDTAGGILLQEKRFWCWLLLIFEKHRWQGV